LAICTVILYFKLVVVLAKKGATSGSRSNADDADYQLSPNRKERYAAHQQWKRIANNDLETLPMALLILWAQYVVDANSTTTAVTMVLFTVARLTHTVCYVYSWQPYRTVAFIIGLLTTFTAAINLIVATG